MGYDQSPSIGCGACSLQRTDLSASAGFSLLNFFFSNKKELFLLLQRLFATEDERN